MGRSLLHSGPFLALLAMSLVLHCTLGEAAGDGVAITYRPAGGEGSLRAEDCASACNSRCSKTHHKKPCLFYCNMCCKKCLCVPSGTYGNKEECPCYNNWKNKSGGPKCP